MDLKKKVKEVAEWLEIKEVEVAKPPAKTTEKPVHAEDTPQPPEDSAIEVKEPEPVESPKIGEEGKRRRIKR